MPNKESEKLHERFGFKFVGTYPKCGFKQETWWDVGFWDLELQAHPKEPKATIGVTEAIKRPEAAEILQRATRAIRS